MTPPNCQKTKRIPVLTVRLFQLYCLDKWDNNKGYFFETGGRNPAKFCFHIAIRNFQRNLKISLPFRKTLFANDSNRTPNPDSIVSHLKNNTTSSDHHKHKNDTTCQRSPRRFTRCVSTPFSISQVDIFVGTRIR